MTFPRTRSSVVQAGSPLWADPASFGTTLLCLWLDQVPESVDPETKKIEWDAETIIDTIERVWSVRPDPVAFTKLVGVLSILRDDRFFDSLPDFIDTCNLLSGKRTLPDTFEPAFLPECMWGITEALLVDRPDQNTKFSEQIEGYIKKLCELQSLVTAPRILSFVGPLKWSFPVDDDQETLASARQRSAEYIQELEEWLDEKSQELIMQIRNLPLENSNTKQIDSLFNQRE